MYNGARCVCRMRKIILVFGGKERSDLLTNDIHTSYAIKSLFVHFDRDIAGKQEKKERDFASKKNDDKRFYFIFALYGALIAASYSLVCHKFVFLLSHD
jgi:disulfide oxidoreductase YuzD